MERVPQATRTQNCYEEAKIFSKQELMDTLPNIKQMYVVIYDDMLDAGIVISLQIPIFTDIDGNPVDERKHFGLKQSIKITKPGWILFANESGFATSQKKDGHVGGQQFVVEKGTIP